MGYSSGWRLGRFEGYQAGEDKFNREWSDAKGDPTFSSQIADAAARWNEKNGNKVSADTGMIAVVMAFDEQVCVKLKLPSGSLGGEPIYCYQRGSTHLLREESDVE